MLTLTGKTQRLCRERAEAPPDVGLAVGPPRARGAGGARSVRPEQPGAATVRRAPC